MRRRHVHEAGIARAPGAHRDVQTLGIHRYRENARARSQERAARPGVARFFHPHPVARIEQHAADQLEALLSPGHDQDLVCFAARPAGRLDVMGDRFAQRAQAGRLAVVELGRGDRPQPAAREPRPERDRKQIHTGRPDAEGARGSIETVGALRGRHQRSPATRQGRMLHPGGPGGPPAHQIVRELRRHEHPGSAAPGEIALGLELLTASSVVVRDTPRSSARARDEGSRVPGPTTPSRMARWMDAQICRCNPPRARESRRMRRLVDAVGVAIRDRGSDRVR